MNADSTHPPQTSPLPLVMMLSLMAVASGWAMHGATQPPTMKLIFAATFAAGVLGVAVGTLLLWLQRRRGPVFLGWFAVGATTLLVLGVVSLTSEAIPQRLGMRSSVFTIAGTYVLNEASLDAQSRIELRTQRAAAGQASFTPRIVLGEGGAVEIKEIPGAWLRQGRPKRFISAHGKWGYVRGGLAISYRWPGARDAIGDFTFLVKHYDEKFLGPITLTLETSEDGPSSAFTFTRE